jgi:prolyl-tRNA synthetase
MFAEADLMGIPHRLVIGERGLAEGNVEYKARVEADAKSVALASVVEFVRKLA